MLTSDVIPAWLTSISLEIIVRQNARHHCHRQHLSGTHRRPEHNKRGQQKKESHRRETINPTGKEPIYSKNLILLLSGLRGDQVAKAGKHRIKYDIDEVGYRSQNHIIVSHVSYQGYIDKARNDHTVRLQSCNVPYLVEHQRFCLSHDLPGFLPG